MAWNVASLGVAGACGIVLNALIALVYDDTALGVFNQVFAAYLLFSQLAALGVHHSALQRVATAAEPREQGAAAMSALAVTLVIGAASAVAFWAASPLVAELVASDDVGRGMAWAAPGLIFFALDKVVLGCLNGLGRMRAYAILHAGRFVVMLVAFGACVALDAGHATLPVVLTVAEAVTFLASLVAVQDLFVRMPLAELRRRARDHLAFGVRGFMSGVIADLNTRVDVVMLGYFTTDAVVGVFSFAAILAEGLFQVLVVLRNVYAPTCARLLAAGERAELTAMIHRGRNRTYLVAVPAAALAAAAYFLAAEVLPYPILADSWPYFALLLLGMAAASGYVPFSTMLLHARMPGRYTVLTLLVLLVNLVANAILIAALGPIGAPIGTGLAFVTLAAATSASSRRLLGLAI